MPIDYRRRSLLQGGLAALSLATAGIPLARSESALRFGPPRDFSFELLQARARKLAKSPYQPPPMPAPEITAKIDYATHGQIKFNTAHRSEEHTSELQSRENLVC